MRYAPRTLVRPWPRTLAWLFFLATLGPPAANAVPLDWINGAGGFAGVSANWNPAQVPTAADNLRFDVAGTYNVTFGANAPASNQLWVSNGDLQFAFPTAHTTNDVLISSGTNLPTLRVASGTLVSVNGIRAGSTAGSNGTFEVSGSSTNVSISGASSPVFVGGSTGSGTLNVINGGSLTVPGIFAVPYIGGGSGTVLVQGSGTLRRSMLTIESNIPTYYVHLGTDGTGSVQVQDGGLLTAIRDFRIGETAGLTGSLSLAGGDPIDSARVSIDGDLWIARNDVAGTAAGTGSVSVGSESAMDVTGETWTYDDTPGGLGTLTVEEGGRFATHDLHVGAPATELLLHGGKLQITGGTFDLTGDPLRINSATGTPTVELLAGSDCALNSATVPALEVGGTAKGRLNVLGGSTLTVHDKLAWVGTSAGGDGTLEVGGGGTLVTDQDLIVGRAGHGFLLMDGGGQGTFAGLNVSSQAGGSGFVTLTDAGTDAHVIGDFVMSGLVAGSSGAASACTVTSGAKLWLDKPGDSATLWAPAVLHVTNGGEVHNTLFFYHRGTLDLAGGIVTGGVLDMNGGGRITGSGDVSSIVWDTLDSLSVVTATGSPLLLGDAADSTGYIMRGKLDVGAQDVTLRSAYHAIVGTVSMSGGTLRGPASGINVELNRYLKGSGTVQGPVTNLGSIYADGAGLSFGGTLTGTGQHTQGTLIRFLSGGGFTGGGSILAPVTVDAGASVAPTATLHLGSGAAQLMKIDGKLDAAAATVDFNTTLGAQVNGEVAVGGGLLSTSTSAPLQILTNGLLSGNGTITMPVDLSGRMRPGPGAGQLTALSLTVQPSGVVEIELGDHTIAQGDLVSISGTATLGGTLDIRILANYNAVPGDSFLVMTAGTRVGTFANLTLGGGAALGKFAAHYNGNQVWLVVQPGFADVPGGPGLAGPQALALAPLDSPGHTPALELSLPEASRVRLELFDLGGRRLAMLADGPLPVGRHRFAAPADALPPGGIGFARALIEGSAGVATRVTRIVRLP